MTLKEIEFKYFSIVGFLLLFLKTYNVYDIHFEPFGPNGRHSGFLVRTSRRRQRTFLSSMTAPRDFLTNSSSALDRSRAVRSAMTVLCSDRTVSRSKRLSSSTSSAAIYAIQSSLTEDYHRIPNKHAHTQKNHDVTSCGYVVGIIQAGIIVLSCGARPEY